MKSNYVTIIVILVLAVSTLSIAVINDRNDSEINRISVENSIKDINEKETEETVGIESGVNIDNTNNTNNNLNNMSEENKNESGLGIEVVAEGSGAEAENGKTVAVHYTGKFEDGTVFDSSIQRGTPIEFVLGAGMVIQGWEKGILGMKVGEKRVLTIPSDLGYGEFGAGPIPGGATLIFDVELVDVK